MKSRQYVIIIVMTDHSITLRDVAKEQIDLLLKEDGMQSVFWN